jgi:CubicO group peptidase (beta-lactamase class C family)
MMEALSRRALMGGALAAGGAAMLPHQLWAKIAESDSAYPATRAFISSFVTNRQLAGTLAMIGKGQAPATILAAGHLAMDSQTPVDADSLWRVYSMTKPVTGMAAMILIDDGVMKLDQPVADFLPAFANMKVLNNPEGALNDVVDAKSPITIRQLMTHTAGLAYNFMQKGPVNDALEQAGLYGAVVSRLPIPGFGGYPFAPNLTEFADRLAKIPLVYQPGTQWSYSLGLDLLGRVIEVASGMSFDQFLQQRIFTPLGMSSSYFQVPQSEVKRFTTNYSPMGSVLLPVDPAAASVYLEKPKVLFGGSGLVCSARDYDRFLSMLMGEGAIGEARIMRPETARLGMSNLIDDSVKRSGTFIDGEGFGAGGRVSLPSSKMGEGQFGWAGVAGTIAFVDRKRGVRAGAYAQFIPPTAIPFQDKFPEVLLQDVGR